jgi:phage tail sheath protein FI
MAAVQYKTPGVYVREISAFPPSVVGVETAVPAFIGYTAKAELDHKEVFNEPVAITSLAEFEETFGKFRKLSFDLTEAGADQPCDITLGEKRYAVTPVADSFKFYLYNSMKLFYANGGANCYVVSVGTYDDKSVKLVDLKRGLDAIENQVGPTMLVVPDALLLDKNDYANVVQAMLEQCSKLRDRVAILDVHGGEEPLPKESAAMKAKIQELIAELRKTVSKQDQFSYGMAYYPWLRTSVISGSDITYQSLSVGKLKSALTDEVNKLYPTGDTASKVTEKITKLDDKSFDKELNQDLAAAIPMLKTLYAVIADKLNILPPSAAMAGIYTYTDNTRGVWNAPANIGLSSVVGPTVKITSDMQEDLNVPIEGKAINAIRDFVGRGTLVWGARTLDGNSNDYRYIQVRRTLVYVEQSIKAALNQFVFAANDGQTWVTAVAMISNFLQSLWTQGGLMGAKASEAFTVQCGLGSTMTGMDILNGYMRVQVTLQMIHPAEFIELTFTQKMQGVT